MYLLVFVFLMMSIIGLYTEVYALQISQMMARQKGIGQAMLTWHGGAYLFARANLANLGPDSVTEKGCFLTSFSAPISYTPPDNCDRRLRVIDTDYLPEGYNIEYKWYSIVYAPGAPTDTQQYVITFALPSVLGNVMSPITHPSIGYTPSEILQQIRNSRAPRTAYGLVQGGELVTPDAPNRAPPDPPFPTPHYTVPKDDATSVTYISDGSVCMISPL